MTIFKKIIFIFLISFFISPSIVAAQGDNNPSIEARVIKIIEEKQIEIMENPQLYQKLELELSTPDKK
jgi:type III secretion system FlhB-like substrate exporter